MSDAGEGILSLVGTPIGNLEDASARMVDTLRRADVVLCEDTRVTSKLLSRFEVRVPLMRCDQNVIASRVEGVLRRLDAGERVAFVSDAGMPGGSDPGLLPRKAGARERRLQELQNVPGALVFYESPHRVVATLQSVAAVMPKRRVALVRELTKVHEEVVRGNSCELAQQIAERPEVRGECVVVVEGPVGNEGSVAVGPSLSLEEAIDSGLRAGESKSQLAKRLSREFSLRRSEVYDKIVNAGVGYP